jgi:N-acyl-D-aspartate/D-glutamate deacylase
LSESIRHGVTSFVIGNCSLFVAVGKRQMLVDIFQRVETLSHQLSVKWLKQSVSWQTPAEYLEHLQQLPLGANTAHTASLTGQAQLKIPTNSEQPQR